LEDLQSHGSAVTEVKSLSLQSLLQVHFMGVVCCEGHHTELRYLLHYLDTKIHEEKNNPTAPKVGIACK